MNSYNKQRYQRKKPGQKLTIPSYFYYYIL